MNSSGDITIMVIDRRVVDVLVFNSEMPVFMFST